jgi:transcriptional regulator of acetoin/glycerol metabolism
MRRTTAGPPADLPATLDLEDLKKQRLLEALRRTGGNQSEAGRRLGISRTSVWQQIKRFGIDVKAAGKAGSS